MVPARQTRDGPARRSERPKNQPRSLRPARVNATLPLTSPIYGRGGLRAQPPVGERSAAQVERGARSHLCHSERSENPANLFGHAGDPSHSRSARPPTAMESHRHAMVEMRSRNRPTLDLLRIENREMARVPIFVENVRQQITFAFACIRLASPRTPVPPPQSADPPHRRASRWWHDRNVRCLDEKYRRCPARRCRQHSHADNSSRCAARRCADTHIARRLVFRR